MSWLSFLRGARPASVFGGGLLLLFLVAALFGPFLAPFSPTAHDLDQVLAPASVNHLFGTDENGIDLLSMVLHGARLALGIAGSVVAISFVIGTLVGAAAGYRGGWLEEVLMRLVDVLLSFPGILLNLAIVALVQRPSVGFVIFALCVNGWVGYARVARGQALAVREREYVQAARACGAGFPRILTRHVVPSILGPLVVQATFGFGGVILVEASLSFLGLGPAIPYSWGSLLAQGTTYLWRSSHLAAVPGAAIACVVLGCNLLGDALRDRLDPRSQARRAGGRQAGGPDPITRATFSGRCRRPGMRTHKLSGLLLSLALVSLTSAAPAAAAPARRILHGVVNINTATADELGLLPGVGPSKAQRILEYRRARPFRTVQELVRVKGIGRKSLLLMRPHLTVVGPTTASSGPATGEPSAGEGSGVPADSETSAREDLRR